MSLINQPFLQLNTMEWLGNNKLKLCSAQSQGLLINLMFLMHGQENYGMILLDPRFKQNETVAGTVAGTDEEQMGEQVFKQVSLQTLGQIRDFSFQLSKLLSFNSTDIQQALGELIGAGLLLMKDDQLICPQMVRDAKISEQKAAAGRKGGRTNPEKKFKRFD